MNKTVRFLVMSAGMACLIPATISAHFKLLEPASWITESERGDPQKMAPCGGDPKGEHTLSGTVGKAVGGSTLHLKVQETIYHPGHYRVALAVNSPEELPPDPVTTERTTAKGPYSVWGVIQSPPQLPVLIDGLFPHYVRPEKGAPMQMWETDIRLPNLSCKKCTLQVLQFMAEHGYNQPGGYSYHHCANLEITADANKPLDKGWATETTTQ